MKKEERLGILRKVLEGGKNKAEAGESSFIVVTEKTKNRYFEVSILAGEKTIVIDAPEGIFDPKELEALTNYFAGKDVKMKAAIGLTVWVESPEKAAELIEGAFSAIGNPDDYDIEVEAA